MGTLTALVRCSHPEPVVAVTAVAGILALTAGRGPGTAWVVLAVLAGQLFVGWTNDYLDRERDRAAERKDKPLAEGQVEPGTLARAAAIALIAAIPLSLASGLRATIVHLAAIAAATLYNVGLKLTPLSVLPYAIAFGLLPTFITLGLPDGRAHLAPTWALTAGALIGAGAHFTQVLPDIASERKQGVHGLPQLLGERISTTSAALLLAAAAGAITLGTSNPLPLIVTVPAATAVAATGLTARNKAAFRLTLATAAATVAGFLASGQSLAAQ